MIRSSTRILNGSCTNINSIFNYNCWSCSKVLTSQEAKQFFCPCEKEKILPVSQKNNYFDLFGLNVSYQVDREELTKRFRKLMKKLHPDLYTLNSDLEKKYSADQASLLNKSYKTLSNPIQRCLYLFELNNIDYEKEAKEIDDMDADREEILMHILELNEELDEIKTSEQFKELEHKLFEYMKPFKDQLNVAFSNKDFKQAIKVLSKLRYYKSIYDRLKDLELQFTLTN